MLKLPSIARPAVILSYLTEVRAQITVVYFSECTVQDLYSAPDDLFRLSSGVSRPNQAVNLPPQQGIAAIIVDDDVDNTEWKPILKHAPRLQYLSMAYGPTSSDLAKALALVPNVRFLDLGRNGGGCCIAMTAETFSVISTVSRSSYGTREMSRSCAASRDRHSGSTSSKL